MKPVPAQELKVLSVNVSEKKGTPKKPVPQVDLDGKGVVQDAHHGSWPQQVSVLGIESMEKFSILARRPVGMGDFAENITTSGLDLYDTLPLDRFRGEVVELEVTQIGKKCHGGSCSIFMEVGNCIMPREGIFCRVTTPGTLKPGDTLVYYPKVFRVLVITLSDRASAGNYEDRSGPAIRQLTEEFFSKAGRTVLVQPVIIPDDTEQLTSHLLKGAGEEVDIIFTTGGTGVGPRDITPEVVKPLLSKEIPGIMEMIRNKYGQDKPGAYLSRSVAGIIGGSLVFTLPGSERAVREYLEEIFKNLMHLVYMQHGLDLH